MKGALQVSQFMVTDANRPGQKGYMFNAQRIAAQVLVQTGDIPQAESYMRRSLTPSSRKPARVGFRAGARATQKRGAPGKVKSKPSAP